MAALSVSMRDKSRRARRRCNVNARRWRNKEMFFGGMAELIEKAENEARSKRQRYGDLKKRRLELERRALECAGMARHWEDLR